MKLEMQKGANHKELSFTNWDLSFVGESIDQRGQISTDFSKNHSAVQHKVLYKHESFVISVDDQEIQVDDWDEYFKQFKNKSIIIDSTTMGFVEMLLILRASKTLNAKNKISLVYIEPKDYKRNNSKNVLQRRSDFELSVRIPGYYSIPNFTFMLSENEETAQKIVFFPGYETSRLERFFEDNPMIRDRNCYLVFGVPAFKPGWETNTFANNINIIKEKRLSGRIKFAGASNPLASYNILSEIQKSLQQGDRLFVAPIGTKPSGIGVALFAANNPNTGILYDHPNRGKGRTDETGNWHLYNLEY